MSTKLQNLNVGNVFYHEGLCQYFRVTRKVKYGSKGQLTTVWAEYTANYSPYRGMSELVPAMSRYTIDMMGEMEVTV